MNSKQFTPQTLKKPILAVNWRKKRKAVNRITMRPDKGRERVRRRRARIPSRNEKPAPYRTRDHDIDRPPSLRSALSEDTLPGKNCHVSLLQRQ